MQTMKYPWTSIGANSNTVQGISSGIEASDLYPIDDVPIVQPWKLYPHQLGRRIADLDCPGAVGLQIVLIRFGYSFVR